MQTEGRQGPGKACPAFFCPSLPLYPIPILSTACPACELTLQDGNIDVGPDLRHDIREGRRSRGTDGVSRGQRVLRVTASMTTFGEIGGHRFPKSGLLCGDPKHKRKQQEKYGPEGTQAGCPHDGLKGETDTFDSAYLAQPYPGITLSCSQGTLSVTGGAVVGPPAAGKSGTTWKQAWGH